MLTQFQANLSLSVKSVNNSCKSYVMSMTTSPLTDAVISDAYFFHQRCCMEYRHAH